MISFVKSKVMLEEIFPFPFYWVRRRRHLDRISSDDFGNGQTAFSSYHKLSKEELFGQIKEERERAKSMDDKTFKMTLALTFAMTVLGSTTSLLIGNVPFQIMRTLVASLAALTIFYSLTAGFIALGAIRTMPSYGYGTNFLVNAKRNKSAIVTALASQEAMNIIRHLRNECAYQALRNSFIFLFLALSLFAGSIVVKLMIAPSSPGNIHPCSVPFWT